MADIVDKRAVLLVLKFIQRNGIAVFATIKEYLQQLLKPLITTLMMNSRT